LYSKKRKSEYFIQSSRVPQEPGFQFIDKFQPILLFLSFNEIFTNSNASQLEWWTVGVSHIILKVDLPEIISADVSQQKILMW